MDNHSFKIIVKQRTRVSQGVQWDLESVLQEPVLSQY